MKIKRPESNHPTPRNAKKVFNGIMFDVFQWKQKMFDGSFETFEKISRPDSVNILPVINGKIILTRQKQPGTKPFIGSIGGRIDEGESPIEAARRELMEEAGMEAKKLKLWLSFQPYGKMDWAVYTFIAEGVRKVRKPHLDSGEKISLMAVGFDEFVKLSATEKFRDKEISIRIFQALFDKKLMAKYRRMFGLEK